MTLKRRHIIACVFFNDGHKERLYKMYSRFSPGLSRCFGRSSYPVDEIETSHCTDCGRVVDEADVSLRGSVQLSDFNVPEAVQKLGPNVRSDPVANGDPHSVVLLAVALRKVTLTRGQKRAQYLNIRTPAV